MKGSRDDPAASSSAGSNGATATAANSRAAKPSQQVLVFGLPDAVTASALQTAIAKTGVRRVFVKLITKVP